MTSYNVGKVRDPNWTGQGNEIAVMVSRGEPRRTDEQMVDAISSQIERYLLGYQNEVDATDLVMIGRVVDLIAADYVYGGSGGSGSVWFFRDHLMKYVRLAVEEN